MDTDASPVDTWLSVFAAEAVGYGLPLMKPHISQVEYDDGIWAELEWVGTNPARRLLVTFEGDGITYLAARGPNIHTDMCEGDASTPEGRRGIWRWFRGCEL